ncbi:22962_t:CDS:2, partial [Cetraspora pellucida]
VRSSLLYSCSNDDVKYNEQLIKEIEAILASTFSGEKERLQSLKESVDILDPPDIDAKENRLFGNPPTTIVGTLFSAN